MHVPNQAQNILAILEKLPPGEGFSCYHNQDPPGILPSAAMPEWIVAFHGQRFAGETLTDALGQLTAYLEMRR